MFDTQKFTSTVFKDRVEEVPVPKLAAFFGDSPAVWKIRGMTGEECSFAKMAVANNRSLESIIEVIGMAGSAGKNDMVEAIKALVDLPSTSAPSEIVERYAWLEYGSVDPVCDRPLAVKLGREFPEVFYLLTNKITRLTGAGRLGE